MPDVPPGVVAVEENGHPVPVFCHAPFVFQINVLVFKYPPTALQWRYPTPCLCHPYWFFHHMSVQNGRKLDTNKNNDVRVASNKNLTDGFSPS
jgi:hypothetical protein